MGVRTAQNHSRALSTFYAIENAGSWHPSLDRPEAGVFSAKDLRIRYELRGQDVSAKDLGEGRFELAAGNRRAILHTAGGRFAELKLAWQIGRDEDRVFLDGVCHTGADRDFKFRDVNVDIHVGLELLVPDSPVAAEPPRLSEQSSVVWQWGRGKGERLTIVPGGE